MKTTNEETTIDLRVVADQALTTWRAALEAEKVAQADRAAYCKPVVGPGYPDSLDTRIKVLALEIASLKAADAAYELELVARDALAAAEVAEGIEDALAIDAARIADDVRRTEARRETLRKQLDELDHKVALRINAARDARVRVAAKRREEGLPAPRAVPQPAERETLLQAFDRGASPRVPGACVPNASRIAMLESEEEDLRADRERARVTAEEALAREADWTTARDAWVRAQRETSDAASASADDARRARNAEHEALVAADRARSHEGV